MSEVEGRYKTRTLAIAAILCLAACASSTAQQTDYMKGIAVSASPSPTLLYIAYLVARAFGPHAVPITSKQRAWILHTVRSQNYRSIRNRLYFVDAPVSGPPIIVFERYPNGGEGPIIGMGCDHYMPGVGASFGPGPCLLSPKPVDP